MTSAEAHHKEEVGVARLPPYPHQSTVPSWNVSALRRVKRVIASMRTSVTNIPCFPCHQGNLLENDEDLKKIVEELPEEILAQSATGKRRIAEVKLNTRQAGHHRCQVLWFYSRCLAREDLCGQSSGCVALLKSLDSIRPYSPCIKSYIHFLPFPFI